MTKFANTAQKGSVRYIVFKEKEAWYATALEFNIVESAEDPQLALFRMFEAIRGYVGSFRKIKGARPYSLNQKADKEYEDLWNKLEAKKAIRSPIFVHSHGRQSLAFA